MSDPLDFETPESVLTSTPTRTPRSFTITTDSYISLCSRVYIACCAELSGFADHIPESAFQFYAVTLLWKRFAEILPDFTNGELGFFNELHHLSDYYLHIPSLLRTYLKGIGNFCDPHNCHRQFSLPVIPICETIAGIPYTFGKVNAKTHYFYEAFPAPAIAALRMVADIKYTRNPCEENLLWDLPLELQPGLLESQIESNKPTRNLLGWAPAQSLTSNQLKLFETLKICDNFAQINYLSSKTSIDHLYKTIYGYLAAKSSTWTVQLGPLPPIGSSVQGMAIEGHEYSKFDRSAMYCEGNISVCSSYLLDDKLTKAAVITGYRMAKEPIRNRHCWSCYDFNQYKDVPKSWIRSRNMIYTYGNPGALNEKIYSTAHIAKRVLQNECILHGLKPMEKWHLYM